MNDNQITPFERNDLGLSEPDSGSGGPGPDVASEFAGELVSATGTSRRVSSTFIILGAVVLASGAGLYAMRTIPRAIGIDDTTMAARSIIDGYLRDIEKRQSDKTPDVTDSGLGGLPDFEEEDRTQVAVENLHKNAFVITGVDGVKPATPPSRSGLEDDGPTPAEVLTSEVLVLATRLKVSTIMGGSSPMAIVNGQVLSEGGILTFDRVRDNRTNPVDLVVTTIDNTNGVQLEFADELLEEPLVFVVNTETSGP
ncbi:MAG: hypothetical protein AB8G96_04190 [Phycisphaerales bacterium]